MSFIINNFIFFSRQQKPQSHTIYAKNMQKQHFSVNVHHTEHERAADDAHTQSTRSTHAAQMPSCKKKHMLAVLQMPHLT